MTKLSERFWAKVHKTSTCWLWTGSRISSGYGNFRGENGCNVLVHRFAYETLIGPIPDGLMLDHLCRNPACVNPAHLEPVPARENSLRGVGFAAENARKTHCVNGHPYDLLNTRIRPQGWRDCRVCHRLKERERYRRQRAKALRVPAALVPGKEEA